MSILVCSRGVNVESLKSLVPGGINFATPDEAKGGEAVKDGTLFRLYDEVTEPGFKYIPAIGATAMAQTNSDIKRFYSKLRRGDLEQYADTLRERAIAAGAVLLDFATRADGISDVYHLTATVKGECDDAHAIASRGVEPFGPEMYCSLLDRFESLATERPGHVLRQPREILMGIAGILTEECKVWWSKPFDISSAE